MKIEDYYREKFEQFGYNEKSLGWSKNKQEIRFHNLCRFFDTTNKSLLDIGCGFGDLLKYLKANNIHPKEYTGIDLMPQFIKVAKQEHQEDQYNFINTDFNEFYSERKEFDLIIASGIFGFKIKESEDENYQYVEEIIKKSFDISKEGISFDFVSDKVDYKASETDFYADPAKILNIAYKFSRNVILNNSSMPFEFNIIIFKDDSFSKERTVFSKYLEDFSHE